MQPLQAEKRFILDCLRDLAVPGSTTPADAPGLLQKLDWDWIINTCNTQRIIGFVSFLLKERGQLRFLDHRTRQAFDEGQLRCEIKNRLRQQQFQRIGNILNKRGIPVIPLKGAALTYLVYDILPFREMFDIDILVQQEDMKGAFDLLCDAGFRHRDVYESKNRWHKDIFAETSPPSERLPIGRIDMADQELSLDLHSIPRYRVERQYVELDVPGMWRRSGLCPQLGPNVYMLAPQDQFLYLLLHMVEFFSPRLVQVLDCALIAEKFRLGGEARFDRMYLNLPPSSRPRLDAFYKSIRELLESKSDGRPFSSETSEIFERFFSRDRVPNITPDEGSVSPDSVSGIAIFNNIRSPWKRALFIAGYFFPCREYYAGKGAVNSYLTHWWSLVSRALALLHNNKGTDGKDRKPIT